MSTVQTLRIFLPPASERCGKILRRFLGAAPNSQILMRRYLVRLRPLRVGLAGRFRTCRRAIARQALLFRAGGRKPLGPTPWHPRCRCEPGRHGPHPPRYVCADRCSATPPWFPHRCVRPRTRRRGAARSRASAAAFSATSALATGALLRMFKSVLRPAQYVLSVSASRPGTTMVGHDDGLASHSFKSAARGVAAVHQVRRGREPDRDAG